MKPKRTPSSLITFSKTTVEVSRVADGSELDKSDPRKETTMTIPAENRYTFRASDESPFLSLSLAS